MTLKNGLLALAIVGALVVAILVMRSRTDDSISVPSREFENWRKQWEMQR